MLSPSATSHVLKEKAHKVTGCWGRGKSSKINLAILPFLPIPAFHPTFSSNTPDYGDASSVPQSNYNCGRKRHVNCGYRLIMVIWRKKFCYLRWPLLCFHTQFKVFISTVKTHSLLGIEFLKQEWWNYKCWDVVGLQLLAFFSPANLSWLRLLVVAARHHLEVCSLVILDLEEYILPCVTG